MAAAKTEKTRIREPREGKGDREQGKPQDFTALDFSGAAFQRSVHDPGLLPAPAAPEIAFVGRSNAGKSSAINALANRRRPRFRSARHRAARNSSTSSPWVNARSWSILPDTVYAGVPGAVRRHWETLVGGYVADGPRSRSSSS
jgi:GTP-binding protein